MQTVRVDLVFHTIFPFWLIFVKYKMALCNISCCCSSEVVLSNFKTCQLPDDFFFIRSETTLHTFCEVFGCSPHAWVSSLGYTKFESW